MNLSISGIPGNALKPGFYGAYNTSGASGLGMYSQRLLIVAQMLATGTQAALAPAQAFSSAEAATLWGAGSVAHQMVEAVIATNRGLAPFVVGISDAGASVAATGSFQFAGTATASETLSFFIAGKRVDLGVQAGDIASTLATRLTAAIQARTELPLSAASATVFANLTAKNKGTCGNQIPLSVVGSVAGITTTVNAMANGATDPDIQAALDAVTPSQFHVVALQFADSTSLGKVQTYLDLVSSGVELRPGRAFAAITGAAKNIATLVTLANGLNHERDHISYLPGSPTAPWVIAACVAGVVASQSDPAMPFSGRVLGSVVAPPVALGLTRSEQETLMVNGVTPLESDPAGNVSIVRLVTTRTTTNGSQDLVLLDTNPIAILDYFRQEVRAMYRRKYGESKLNPLTMVSVRQDAIGVAMDLEDLEILQKVEECKNLFVLEADPNVSGRILMKIPVPWVPGLHQAFAEFDLINVSN
ncbi:MAG TPA: phage tail sheath subtilisin-like domain-containing protein [Fibrobacteria bacterium]|nr:phage tail sheath subtilisin-like domain-containing protein [Fibrobacteria bacterium]